ncbi:MAG: DPP IV N-terminal domain-containing protein, partial [Streptosporangiaceae bacterium]
MTPPAASSLPAQIARTGRFTRGVPGRFALGADGDTVLFLRSRAGDDPAGCLWAADLPSGAERLLADPAALASATGQGAGADGIGAYGTDAAATLAAFALAGRLWAAEVRSGLVRELPAQGPVTDARPEPAGRWIGYRSAGSLRVIGADGAADRPLAVPEGPDIEYGAAGYAEVTAQPDRASGYWWAPDGASVLATRTDRTGVAIWYLPDPTRPGEAPRAIRYAAAGAANADVSLWILGLDGTRTRARWDQRAFEYVVGAGWDARGPYAVVQSRDQRTVRFLAMDPASGATMVLAEQRDDCWVQLLPGLPARTGSGAVVAHADRAGTRHLTVAGAAVTPAGLQVRAVLGIHGDDVLFAASDDPVRTDLWAYRPASGLARLTEDAGVHSGIWDGKTLVHVADTGDRPGGRVAVRRVTTSGPDARPVPIASLAERPVLEPHPTRLILGTRELRANLFWPSWHRPGAGSLPVLLDPYGGAGAQRVTDGLDARS